TEENREGCCEKSRTHDSILPSKGGATITDVHKSRQPDHSHRAFARQRVGELEVSDDKQALLANSAEGIEGDARAAGAAALEAAGDRHGQASHLASPAKQQHRDQPPALRPGGSTTSNGKPFTWLVIGQTRARCVFWL